jgi:hypothetical protein
VSKAAERSRAACAARAAEYAARAPEREAAAERARKEAAEVARLEAARAAAADAAKRDAEAALRVKARGPGYTPCVTLAAGGKATDGIRLVGGAIAIGEKGRSRKQISVVAPEGALIGEYDNLLGVPARVAPAGSVLVLIRDQSGFRGGWSMLHPSGVLVLVEGQCAQGDAGNMGGGSEYLAMIAPGGSFEIKRTGRIYGDPESLSVRVADGRLVMTDVSAAEAAGKAAAALTAAL